MNCPIFGEAYSTATEKIRNNTRLSQLIQTEGSLYQKFLVMRP